MTYLHRFVFGTILVAGLSSATVRAAEPDKLIPASADTVVQVNVREILEADITKKYALEQLKQLLDGNDAKKILTELGLDPLKDIDQLIISGNGTNKNDSKVLFIVHGNFNPDKLTKAAEGEIKKNPDKLSVIKEDNTTIYKFPVDHFDKPFYATILDEKTVVAASEKSMILSAVKANGANEAASIKQELAELLKKVDGKASIYATSIVKGKLDDIKIPGGGGLPVDLSAFQELLPQIETMSLVVRVKSDVNVEMTLGMKNENAAGEFQTAFNTLLKQIKPLVGLLGGNQPQFKPLVDVLDSIKTLATKKDCVITGKVTGANIGKIINPDD
jgi:hypothetical protein